VQAKLSCTISVELKNWIEVPTLRFGLAVGQELIEQAGESPAANQPHGQGHQRQSRGRISMAGLVKQATGLGLARQKRAQRTT